MGQNPKVWVPVLFGSLSGSVRFLHIFTLCAKLSGAVYCNRSCLWVCMCVCVCLWVCYNDNSKFRA